MKVTTRGQITIPPAIRKKHGLMPKCEVQFIDQPEGVLIVKARKASRAKRVLATLLRGGKVRAHTDDWLQLTRGDS